jgi:hypothetical protein
VERERMLADWRNWRDGSSPMIGIRWIAIPPIHRGSSLPPRRWNPAPVPRSATWAVRTERSTESEGHPGEDNP